MPALEIQIGADIVGATRGVKKLGKDLDDLATGSIAETRESVKRLKLELSQLDATALRSRGGKVLAQEYKAARVELKALEAQAKISSAAGGNIASQAFGQLRTLANILPGIGIGGLVGIGFGFIEQATRGLFDFGSAAEDAKKKHEELQESINKVFEASGKEAAQVATLVSVLRSETETRTKKLGAIKELQRIQPEIFKNLQLEGTEVRNLDAAYASYLNNLRNVIALKIKQGQLEEITTKILKEEGATLTKSEQDFINQLKKRNEGLKESNFQLYQLNKQIGDKAAENRTLALNKLYQDQEKLLIDINELTSGVKTPKPNSGKTLESFYSKTIAKAKELARFLNANTQRIFQFEVDPRDSLLQTFEKAKSFIDRATNDYLSFELKPFVVADPENLRNEGERIKVILANSIGNIDLKNNLRFTDKGFGKALEEADKIREAMQREIERTTKSNPILLTAKLFVDTNEARGKEYLSALGIDQSISLLTDLQKQTVFAANAVRNTLTPAFQNLFAAILQGENPMKSFFDSLGQAVLQLIQKLIAAAVQALILSALFPGGAQIGGKAVSGFGGFFKNIMGFAAGGIVTGPTLGLIGEGFGTSASNPEVVAPLDQLKAYLKPMQGGAVVLAPVIRGRDIALTQRRESQARRRATGR